MLVLGGLLAIGALTLLTGAVGGELAGEDNETESAYVEPVPEAGDPFFEESAEDGSWVSYVNPRDEYRDPYLGGGSGKLCVTLLEDAGDPIVGETVPNTTVTIPTGDSLSWHSHADPFVVEFPLTDTSLRPLDADQFGTSSDHLQGDGYLDSHCLEWHGLPENATIEYGEAEIEGQHADRIEVVGYVQQAGAAWDSDVDPIADAESYEEVDGGWTYQTEESHGQTVVVLQLADRDTTDERRSSGSRLESTGEWAGLGVIVALVVLSIGTFLRYRQ